MYLTQGLHRAFQQKPDSIATIFQGRKRSFREIATRVAKLAGALQGLGMKAGDRVGMLSLNSDRYLEYYLGVYWAGGAVNPANIRWTAAEIAYSLDDCETAILIVDDTFKVMAQGLKDTCKSLKVLIHVGDGEQPAGMLSYEGLIADAAPVADAYRSGSDLAGVFYTGGTTGFPKGVMLSHINLASNCLAVLAAGVVTTDSVGLHAAPMFHLADGAFMNAMMAAGGTHVMIPSFTPVGVMQAIQGEQVSASLLVPTMIQMLADHPEVANYKLDSLKSVLYGASPISEAVIDRAMKALPSAAFCQAYGMTELSPVATLLLPKYHLTESRPLGKMRSAGTACTLAEVRIVDGDGKEVPLGTVGEVAVRGPGVMLGYWNKPTETAAAVRDGWMHTGDGGRMDEDGFVFIVDRIKDMIVTGGENVYSIEVENALLKHPAVAQCAVIGIPSEQWGELVHASVVLKPGAQATPESIIEHCKPLIANYKCPRSVAFLEALPLSGAGKILKNKLREPFWKDTQRNVS
jgi:acyl-CoA synthetase (AMP-forming)/AMP-acid ligase II